MPRETETARREGDRVTCSTAARREEIDPRKTYAQFAYSALAERAGRKGSDDTHAGVKPEFFSAGNAVSRPFTPLCPFTWASNYEFRTLGRFYSSAVQIKLALGAGDNFENKTGKLL